jgi:aminoglycoside phosphotransferase (APT) family kinase protein
VEPLDAGAVARAFRAVYPAGGTVGAVRAVPGAFSHEVWLVDAAAGRHALKVARVERDPARVANAVAAQRLAQAAGVPTPRIVATDDGAALGRPLLVQEWVAGRDAESAWSRLPLAQREAFARAFGGALARVHAVPGPAFSDDVALTRVVPSWPASLRAYLTRHAARTRAAGLLPPATVSAAVARLEAGIAALPPDVAPGLTHWDVWLANTLVDGAGAFAGLLDWESAAYSDPLVDFVKLEVFVFDRHPETRRPFAEGYWGPAATPPPGTAERLDLYRGVEYLAHVAHCTDWGLPALAAEYRRRLTGWLRGARRAAGGGSGRPRRADSAGGAVAKRASRSGSSATRRLSVSYSGEWPRHCVSAKKRKRSPSRRSRSSGLGGD